MEVICRSRRFTEKPALVAFLNQDMEEERFKQVAGRMFPTLETVQCVNIGKWDEDQDLLLPCTFNGMPVKVFASTHWKGNR